MSEKSKLLYGYAWQAINALCDTNKCTLTIDKAKKTKTKRGNVGGQRKIVHFMEQ